jgi:OOP family OmpA-OmpF porin
MPKKYCSFAFLAVCLITCTLKSKSSRCNVRVLYSINRLDHRQGAGRRFAKPTNQKGKSKMKLLKLSSMVVVTLVSLAVLGFNIPGNAAEIIYQEDITQNVVTKDVLVRTADNVIVLVDASSSMAFSHRKFKKTNYELEKEALAAGYSRLPDLGYNVGIYTFSPSWKEIYPVQKFDAAKVSEAMKQLPAQPSGRTPLVAGLEKLEGVLKGLSGKTVVYIFSDGGWEKAAGGKDPGDKAAELARKYNVCFIVISYAVETDGIKRVKDMGKANACSRVIPFDSYITNPYYALGPLYYTTTATSVETMSEKKIAGIKIGSIYFDYDKFDLKPQEKEELNQLGKFLQANPKAFVAVQGFCDSRGTPEYNMKLSRERAEAVTDYLVKNSKVDPARVATMWYGEANPAASNDTAEGRTKNRRVEIAVSGL